jgi:hypothetical protein
MLSFLIQLYSLHDIPTHVSIPGTVDPSQITSSQVEHIPITQALVDPGDESDSEPPSVLGQSVEYDTREGCNILVAPAFPPSHLNSKFVFAC